MEYLKWIGFGVQAISFALIFMAFVPRQGSERDQRKIYFRPWFLAYGLVLFALWSLIDMVLKMNFLR